MSAVRQFRAEGERPLKVPSPPAPTAVFTGVRGRAGLNHVRVDRHYAACRVLRKKVSELIPHGPRPRRFEGQRESRSGFNDRVLLSYVSYGPRNRSPSKWIKCVGESATHTSVSQEISPR